jgi:hypothetical protein
MDQVLKAVGNREGKYLMSILAGEEYGIGLISQDLPYFL